MVLFYTEVRAIVFHPKLEKLLPKEGLCRWNKNNVIAPMHQNFVVSIRSFNLRIQFLPFSISELVQLKLNIETSVGESTPTEAEYGVPLPLEEVGVSRLDEIQHLQSYC